jgi:GrpB-like predicted nucleotidyltransferase (UPF0157 family)
VRAADLERLLALLRETVDPHYDALGSVDAVYVQGSLVECLADVADLDVVVVRSGPPPASAARDPSSIADAAPPPTTFDQQGFVLDRFFVDGQQFDVKHVACAELDEWVTAVEDAGPAATSGYPMPAIAVHGLVEGVVLRDTAGVLAAARTRASAALASFAAAARRRVEDAWPSHRDELTASAARGDGLLFHEVAVPIVRLLFIAWFASQGRWWPHEKRLSERLRRAGRHDLADAEAAVWAAATLEGAARAVQRLAGLVNRDLDADLGPLPEKHGRRRPRPATANTVVAPDPTWPAQFDALAAVIRPALEGTGAMVDHIGSTAVPGLPAKPIIDIDVGAPDGAAVPEVIDRLVSIGYVHQGDLGLAGREAFDVPAHLPYHHLYVVVLGSEPQVDHALFRDYLRGHPDAAKLYGDHKLAVAHLITADSRQAYLDAKTPVVARLLADARRELAEAARAT